MIRALILTHGSLGDVLMRSVEAVLGAQPDVRILSNDGRSLEQMVAEVDACVGKDPAIVFVDLCGGSTYFAGCSFHDHHPTCALISGVNLPMLLSFFTKREKLSFRELVDVVAADGHRGIQTLS